MLSHVKWIIITGNRFKGFIKNEYNHIYREREREQDSVFLFL